MFVVGNEGNDTNVIFMNLMANMVDRAGRVLVRVGGNSQEQATVVPDLPNNEAIDKINKVRNVFDSFDSFSDQILLDGIHTNHRHISESCRGHGKYIPLLVPLRVVTRFSSRAGLLGLIAPINPSVRMCSVTWKISSHSSYQDVALKKS